MSTDLVKSNDKFPISYRLLIDHKKVEIENVNKKVSNNQTNNNTHRRLRK